MNKKIAIITIYGEFNYGNRLQNYAVCHCFNKWGYSCETIVRLNPKTAKRKLIAAVRTIIPLFFKGFSLKKFPHLLREHNFKSFTRSCIPTRYIKTRFASLPKSISNEYDYFVVGSDQVWNPCFGEFNSLFNDMLLTFAPSEKKLCFSPSFGISKLPEEWESRFATALANFPRLCVREQDGVNIIKALTGRSAQVLIDPTLMLDAEDWLKVSKKVSGLEEPFVLDYFLGQTPEQDSVYKSALSYAHIKRRIKLLDKSDRKIYVGGPAEFIYIISEATLICTDSFHACIFSILFSKPFIVFKRRDSNRDMFSRMQTLLDMFGIDLNESIGKIITISPETRDSVLKEKRQQVKSFLVGLSETKYEQI